MAQDVNGKIKKNDGIESKKKAFPGFVQLVVLLSLFPVVYDGSIFFVFGALSIDSEILSLENAYDTIHFNALTPNRRQVVNFNEYSYIAAVLLYPFALIACLIKKRWGWLIFGLSALHFVFSFLLFGTGKEGEVVDYVKEIVHPASFIALAWFILFGRLISKSFVFFILLCLITPMFLVQGGFPKFVLFPSIAMILLALVGKLVSYAIYQNLYLFKSVGFFGTIWLALKSVYFWVPLLLIIVPLQYFNWWWHTTIEDQLYEFTYYEENLKRRVPLVGQASWQGRYLENDLRWSIRNYLAMKQQSLNKRLSDLEHKLSSLDAKEYADEAIEKVGQEFDRAFPENLNMKGKKFDGFLSDAKEWASDESAKMTQAAYTKVRDNAREKLMAKLSSVSDEQIVPFVENKSDYIASFVPKVKETTDQILLEVNADAQYSGQWTLRYLRMSHFVFSLIFLFVCVKSFLYVFSRVAFDSETKLFVTLRDASAGTKIQPPDSTIEVFGKEYTLNDDISSQYYFSRKFEPLDCPPKFSMPQAAAAPIARILHGTLALNQVNIKQDAGKVHFSALKDAHFVEWELSDDETVIFDYRNFVGMSASISLSVLISMRVSTLLFDKIIYPTARGPGKLILLTDGVPRVGDNDFTQSSMPSNRIVAWQKDILFHTVSELNFIDVYMSSTYIKKVGAGILVMDADKRGIPKNGLTRFIKHFFLP